MNKIIIESLQALELSFTITALIAVFVIGVRFLLISTTKALRLMFSIMDKIGKGQKAFGPKDRPVTEAIKRNPERVKEGGVVHLNIPKVKPPLPTTPQQPPQKKDK